MASAYREREAAVLELLAPNLEAQGFQVFLQPSANLLPPFMVRHRPDAIALKDGRKIAIQVVSSASPGPAALEQLRQAVAAHPEWELQVTYAPTASTPAPAVQTPEQVRASLERVMAVFDSAGPVAGLLLAWAVLEAAARALLPEALDRPQTPASLLERLAADGYVTPDEADHLRRLGELHNQAAHGGLDVAVARDDVAELLRICRTLLDAPEDESIGAAPG